MIAAVQPAPVDWLAIVVGSAAIFVATAGAVWLGYTPLRAAILRRQQEYDSVLRGKLLMDIEPRTATILSGVGIAILGLIGYAMSASYIGAVAGMAAGVVLPSLVLKALRRRHLQRLENQLVGGIVTLASAVRAGLNLVQALELLAKDGPAPLGQEIAHLLREYEYGVPLEEAMDNAAARIGSGDFRLVFAALQTHRRRGGDLGETLDRIADSIREIQRLENRVKTLTAQGRANARMLGLLVAVVLGILYLIEPGGVRVLFVDSLGKAILFVMVLFNVVGFLWIKKIISIDI